MLNILFQTDVGPSIGMGHLTRCCALGAAINGIAPCTCRFEPAVIDEAATILAGTGTPVGPASAVTLYDVAVIDLATHGPDVTAALRNRARLTVQITDDPSVDRLADVAIQPFITSPPPQSGTPAVYGGRDFILLHPAYADRQPAPVGDVVGDMLLCFGGSDPANLSLRVTHVLSRLGCRASFRLALGPLYNHGPAVDRSAGAVPLMSVVRGLPTLAHEMASCDLAVVSGGTLMYEACAMGRPTVVLSQNASQAQEAQAFAREGAVLDLGTHETASDAQIEAALVALWDDANRRRTLGTAAARLVPVGGAARAARRVLHDLEARTARDRS